MCFRVFFQPRKEFVIASDMVFLEFLILALFSIVEYAQDVITVPRLVEVVEEFVDGIIIANEYYML